MIGKEERKLLSGGGEVERKETTTLSCHQQKVNLP